MVQIGFADVIGSSPVWVKPLHIDPAELPERRRDSRANTGWSVQEKVQVKMCAATVWLYCIVPVHCALCMTINLSDPALELSGQL